MAMNNAVSVFTDYLTSRFGYGDRELERFNAATLDSTLTTFYAYAEVRTLTCVDVVTVVCHVR